MPRADWSFGAEECEDEWPAQPRQGALIVGALGVVFGDIGTSPLYTVQIVFNPGNPHPVSATRDTNFGIASLIFWSVMTIVTVTYVSS